MNLINNGPYHQSEVGFFLCQVSSVHQNEASGCWRGLLQNFGMFHSSSWGFKEKKILPSLHIKTQRVYLQYILSYVILQKKLKGEKNY